MIFRRGQSYTREQIHAEFGGEMVSYLPQKGGRIVCGCFSTDSNPDAPNEILVGGHDEAGSSPIERKARMLASQREPIPTFLKQTANAWVYEGKYRVRRVIEDCDYIERKQRRANRTDVTLALVMEPVEVAHSTYLLTWNPR
jgi:hypothetical protein